MEDPAAHLSHVSTLWTLVRRAHAGDGEAVLTAQERLMEWYAGAAHRYLLGALRDREAADELFQEFALRLVRGDFKNADPQRGRFRDYLKAALFHLVVDFQRRRQNRPASLDAGAEGPAVGPPNLPESEPEFLEAWRQQLMDRAWAALADWEQQTGQPGYTVLRFRADHPLLPATDLAERLGARMGKSFTVDGVRKALQRAREKYVELLVDEVAGSLAGPTPEAVEEELRDLGLYAYCRPALQRRGRG
jgi:RNA polymerase sigma-70 factor (ECF subfamily)